MGEKGISPGAVFVDRDGTLNYDVGYCSRPQDIYLLPGVGEGVRLLNQAGLKVIVVTNQSGIGRGYFRPQAVEVVHARLREELAQGGAWLDAIYYCPHRPEDGCSCRKPVPGLVFQALWEQGVDLSRSYFLGDREGDILLGKNLGRPAALVSQSSLPWPVDYQTPNFLEAGHWVLGQERRPSGP